MVALRSLLFGALALLVAELVPMSAVAQPRSLPPPAGDSRAGTRSPRRTGPAAASAAKKALARRPAAKRPAKTKVSSKVPPPHRPKVRPAPRAAVKPTARPEPRPEAKSETKDDEDLEENYETKPQGGPQAESEVAAKDVKPEVKRAVDTASSLVGQRDIVVDGVDYGDDCAALVRAAFARAGRPLPPTAKSPASIHALAASRELIKPGAQAAVGDVIFLADKPGGTPAHVGIVERVDASGKAIVLHRVARGVMRLRVSLTQPNRAMDSSGKRLNDVLVIGAAPVPAGSLVVALANLM